MNLRESQDRRQRRAADRRRTRLRGIGVLAFVIIAVVVVIVVIAAGSSGNGGGTNPGSARRASAAATGRGPEHASRATSSVHRGGTVSGQPTGTPGTTPVPVLMYHVIAPPPGGAQFPGLYVSGSEFAAQMHALKAAGWHAVTLDQVRAYWTKGVALGAGKPVVLTFDNGYRSQYADALPVLSKLHWVADENIQLSGLPPSQGGLSAAQVRGLVNAGWELDTQGISHADLITLGPAVLAAQIAGARRTLQRRYGVPVNWFCYPSGHYDATVIAEAKRAGYVGSTTVVPGWAQPGQDLFTLPRLRVLGGTSPAALLDQINSARGNGSPPGSYGGSSNA